MVAQVKKLFVDTNVLLDVLQNRQPHYRASVLIWGLAEAHRAEVFVSAISFNNVYYILRRHVGREAAQQAVEALDAVFQVVAPGQAILRQALQAHSPDFEDAIQFFSALSIGAECIITRNVRDYPTDVLPIWSPEAFLAQMVTGS